MQLEDILQDRDLIVFDLETTGTSVQTDRIVEFAAVRIFADGRKRQRLRGRINPTIPIPAGASNIHGITDEMVAKAPTFCQMADRIARFLEGADLAGYNVLQYDLPLIREEFRRCGRSFDIGARRVIDGMQIFKHFERRTLEAALRHYCGEEHVDAHGALEDVRATIKVLEAQLDRYDEIPNNAEGLAKISLGRRITPDGKVIWQDGEACLSFGKHAGVPLRRMIREQRDYLSWILKADFSEDVKQVVQDALGGKIPVQKEDQKG